MSENRSTTQPTGAGVFAVAELKRRMAEREAGEQIWLTDRDACSMATSGRGSGVVGYNVQTAVDTNHQLIVTHEGFVTRMECDVEEGLGRGRSCR
jgi:hypothetical protein